MPLAFIPLIIPLAGLAALAFWLRHMHERHGLGPLLWRWHSGQPLDGYPRANATWMHRSSDTLHHTGRAIGWHHLPRLARAGIRCGTELACLAALAGLALDAGMTIRVLACLAAAGLAYGAWRGYRFARDFRFYVRYVWKLKRALTDWFGVPPKLKISKGRDSIRLSLPPTWRDTRAERDKLESLIRSRTGIEFDPDNAEDAAYRTQRRAPYVIFSAAVPPPALVELADPKWGIRVRSDIAALPPGSVLGGYGRRSVEQVRNIRGESPMVAVSMPTKQGKSVTSGLVAATLASQGYIPVIADCKMTSHRWAKGLPNVSYASRIPAIHDQVLWLEKDVQRRYDLVDRYADINGRMPPGMSVGPPVAFLIEELNTLQKWLARHWRELRAGDRSLPARSPATDGLDTLLCISRAAEYIGILIAQRLSAAATSGAGGNADARENIVLKWAWDPGMGTWRMIGNDCPCPKARNHPGRYQLIDPAEVHEVQGVLATNAELRDLAVSGIIASPPEDMPFVTRDWQAREHWGGRQDPADGWTWRAEEIRPRELVGAAPRCGGDGADYRAEQQFHLGGIDPHLDAELVGEAVQAGGQDELITLRESVDLGIARRKLSVAQWRSTHDRRHPAPAGKRGTANLYNAIDLADYWARAA